MTFMVQKQQNNGVPKIGKSDSIHFYFQHVTNIYCTYTAHISQGTVKSLTSSLSRTYMNIANIWNKFVSCKTKSFYIIFPTSF